MTERTNAPTGEPSILSGILGEGAMEESIEADELDDDGDEEMDDTNAAANE